jgi:hypothetical protein
MADPFRQPLRRRGISDHLKALRPSALAAASLAVAAAAVGLGIWLVTASDGYYAGPVVRVSVAPAYTPVVPRKRTLAPAPIAAVSETGEFGTHGIAREIDLPVRRGQIIDDASYDAIRRRLALLEEEAHRSGVAIGSGAGLAVTIDAVQAWARELAQRGVDLVPASVVFRTPEARASAAADDQN